MGERGRHRRPLRHQPRKRLSRFWLPWLAMDRLCVANCCLVCSAWSFALRPLDGLPIDLRSEVGDRRVVISLKPSSDVDPIQGSPEVDVQQHEVVVLARGVLALVTAARRAPVGRPLGWAVGVCTGLSLVVLVPYSLVCLYVLVLTAALAA